MSNAVRVAVKGCTNPLEREGFWNTSVGWGEAHELMEKELTANNRVGSSFRTDGDVPIPGMALDK